MKLFSKINSVLSRKDRKKLLILTLIQMFSGLMDLVGVVSIVPFISIITDPTIIEKNYILLGIKEYLNFNNIQIIVLFAFISFFLILFNQLFRFLSVWYGAKTTNNLMRNLHYKVFNYYLNKPYEFHLTNSSNHLLEKVHVQTNNATSGVIVPLFLIIGSIFTTFFLTALLMITNYKITFLIISIVFLFYIFVLKNLRQKITELGTFGPMFTKKTFQIIDQAFKSIKNIKIKDNSKFYSNLLFPLSTKYSNNMTNLHVIGLLPRVCLELLAYFLLFSILVILIFEGYEISKIAPLIAIFALSIQKILPAGQNIYQQIVNIKYYMPSFDIIFQDLLASSKEEIKNKKSNKNFNSDFEIKNIKLKNLVFKYPSSQKNILDISNLEIKKGSFIGITGMTGSGKTTLIDILLGILNPTSGKILMDNMEINEEVKKKWLKKVGYASQFTFIADDTIKNNIALGELPNEIIHSKILRACELADIKDFIEQELPEKYDTKLGENGARLSGGQIQRVNIARAFYNNPDFLVFDESTSSLDNLTERKIINSINKLDDKITLIMITHKLSSLKNCDNIILMEDGKISAQGNYSEVYANSKTFRELDKLKNRN